ncbi:MAG: choice-of-anchor Q domain-containing protein [Chitinophagaceae bacterium]
MKQNMKSIFTLLLVMVCCSAQRANATIIIFQFGGTITTSNISGVSIGDPFVATLSYDDAQSPYEFSSTGAKYDNFTFTINVAGLTFSKQPGQYINVGNGINDFFDVNFNSFPHLYLRLSDLSASAFNSTALPASLQLASFPDFHSLVWEETPTAYFQGNITSITSCVTDPIVTTNADAGPGSLRQAMIDACPGSTITFDPSLNGSTITLSNMLPTITQDLTITGPGANNLTISGNNAVQVFGINGYSICTISGLNIINGTDEYSSCCEGGAISIDGAALVTINNCMFKNNKAQADGGAIYSNSSKMLTIYGSTFSENIAAASLSASGSGGGGGGAISVIRPYNITNCTFTGNKAETAGALRLGPNGSITNCTITANVSSFGGGGIQIFCCGSASIKNSIVAGNSAPNTPDISGLFNVTSNNIIGIGENDQGFSDGIDGNQLGTASNPINPRLEPLDDNGGTTLTMALSPGSPAVNAGTFNNTPNNDQRGFGRKFDFDIGAYELQSATTVTTITSSPAPSCIGSPVIITATVTSDGYPVTSGTVYLFKDNLTATIAEVNSAGQISYSTASLTEGTHTIKADFKGSTIFGESTGYGTHTVSPLPTANITGTSTCAGTATTLTASSAASNPSFIWSEIPIGGGGGAGKVLSTSASYTTEILNSSTSYNLKITDGTSHCSSTSVVDVTVNLLPVISPATLPAGKVGVGYSQNITASGGTGSYVIGLLSGLPPGLTLTSSGLLSGTPTTPGTYQLNVYAKDTKGCTATMQYSLAISVSCTITCPANITVNNKTGLCGAYVTYPAATTAGTCGTLTYSIKSGSWFVVGTTNVTVTSSAGANCSFTVTVKDVQKPVIVCPSDITVTAASNSCNKVVTFNLSATDNCPGVTVTTVPVSGYNFPVGTTAVTATATDLSGNKTTSTFTVKVKESQPPVIRVVATPIVLLWPANGSYQTINVSQCVVSVTDNCSSIPVSSVKITKVTSDEAENASGDADGNTTKDIKIASDCKSVDLRRERKSTGNGRVYTIYLAVTDASGNTGTASFKVIAPISQNGTTATDNGSACTVSSYCSGNSNRSAAGISAEEQIVKNEIPEGFMMEQNYPNPFSTVTTIRYALPAEAQVSLGIYNQLGQRVTQLVDGRMSAGYHQARFDATKLSAGIYLYRLLAVNADGKPIVLTKKMIVAK